MGSLFARCNQPLVCAGFVLSLLAASAAPLLDGQSADAAKTRNPKVPNVAIRSIAVQPTGEANHDSVLIEVANLGKRNANGFRIELVAVRSDGTERSPVYSLPLSLPKGASTEVEFRLSCSWINNGALTAKTDPIPVIGERNTANNVLTQRFGASGCS
jgi:hypothetical protein